MISPSRAAVAWLAGASVVAMLAGCGGAAGRAAQGSATAHASASSSGPTPGAAAPSPSPSPSASALVPLPVAPGAGLLHQTMVRPRSSGSAFRAMVADLWLAVRTGKPSLGLPAFFPVDAYKQVKAIYDPAADWRGRLWLDFTLDVRAAHALLGKHPDRARFVRAIVPSGLAAWIDPGVCYNSTGYWHVGNSRVVYRIGRQVRSFGIASLISWRGVWYVVHFGGVVRPAVGMVDAPAAGPGYPGPQGGC